MSHDNGVLEVSKAKKPLKKNNVMLHLDDPDHVLFDSVAGKKPLGPTIRDLAKEAIERRKNEANELEKRIDKLIKAVELMFKAVTTLPKDVTPTPEQAAAMWDAFMGGDSHGS